MSRSERNRACRAATAVLLLCVLGCLCVADATLQLERANERRRVQLDLLECELNEPMGVLGPIAALDGLFARRIERAAGADGGLLVFAGVAGGDP